MARRPDPAVRSGGPSARPGMGAVVYDGGTTFRVWAPFARSVAVVGTFNAWSVGSDPLVAEGDGRWSADVPGAVAGDQYKFAVITADGQVMRNDPYAREVTNSAGNSVIREPAFDWGDAPYATPPWDELVVYELHAGTFNDAPGGLPGGFQSVMNRLDYLRELGVNAIELMPSAEFAADFSWGYNPSHIFAIEQAYGGPARLKELIRAAHERGIAVIYDVVYNHFGPSDLDLWRFDGWSADGGGGIYFYNDWRRRTPWGDTRPDYGRPEVRRFILDNARMWLEEFRFDGLRWDATAYIRNVDGSDDPGGDLADGWRLLREVTGDTDARQPWKLHIAEDLRGDGRVTRPAGDGGAGFDTQWDGGFVHPVRRVLTAVSDGDRSMEELRGAIARVDGGDAFRRVIYTESHDEVANGRARLPEEIWPGNAGSWPSRKRSTLGAALVLTAPGIPMLFQGQELLEDAWFHDEDPVDWTKERSNAGIVRLYRDLIRLRRNWFGATRGLRGHHVNVHHVNDADKLVAFHRWDRGGPGDDVVVVVNVSARAYGAYRVGMPRPGRWRVRFNGDWDGYDGSFGGHPSHDTVAGGPPADGMPCGADVGIGPYTAVILSQDP